MEPFSILLIAGLVLVYFAFYRPAFILKPEKDRKLLLEKFEQAAALNRQLITDIRQYADNNNLWETTFLEGDTFRKKLAELEAARDELFGEQTHLGLRSLNPKKLNMELMDASLEDQLRWHHRLRIALGQHKTQPVIK